MRFYSTSHIPYSLFQSYIAVWRVDMKFEQKNPQSGFTLIELMVVMVILATLAVFVVPKFMDEPKRAQRVKVQVTISNLETALKTYYLDNGYYPTTDQGLEALVMEPNIDPVPGKWRKGGYLEKGKVPVDPWGNDYIYLSPGLHGDFDIISYALDGVEGGEDWEADVESWNLE
jgi:general secretion pathway protein G